MPRTRSAAPTRTGAQRRSTRRSCSTAQYSTCHPVHCSTIHGAQRPIVGWVAALRRGFTLPDRHLLYYSMGFPYCTGKCRPAWKPGYPRYQATATMRTQRGFGWNRDIEMALLTFICVVFGMNRELHSVWCSAGIVSFILCGVWCWMCNLVKPPNRLSQIVD